MLTSTATSEYQTGWLGRLTGHQLRKTAKAMATMTAAAERAAMKGCPG